MEFYFSNTNNTLSSSQSFEMPLLSTAHHANCFKYCHSDVTWPVEFEAVGSLYNFYDLFNTIMCPKTVTKWTNQTEFIFIDNHILSLYFFLI